MWQHTVMKSAVTGNLREECNNSSAAGNFISFDGLFIWHVTEPFILVSDSS